MSGQPTFRREDRLYHYLDIEINGGKERRDEYYLIPSLGDRVDKDVIKNICKRTKGGKKFGHFVKFSCRLEVPLDNPDRNA